MVLIFKFLSYGLNDSDKGLDDSDKDLKDSGNALQLA
jgi:hypothetical protein